MSYHLPKELIDFIYVSVLSFLVGLELKTYRLSGSQKEKAYHIGSTRTFTFIGIMGYIFFQIDKLFYLSGYIALIAIYLYYYQFKLHREKTSIISFLLISLVYSFGPLSVSFDIWMSALLFVLIVFVLNSNRSLRYLFEKLNLQEFETLGKFLLLSGVILPLLPDTKLPYIEISPFKIWLVVVIISSISYGSYIAQKYIFKSRGYMLTAILGGLYSSTATTVVLAKKSSASGDITTGAIIAATAMMYVRILIISVIFNKDVADILLPPMLIFFLIGISIGLYYYKRVAKKAQAPIDDRNPLELGTAFLFALLFVIMMAATMYVTSRFGDAGLKFLSFIIGFTDIDPFVLSLLTGKYSLETAQIATAILIASGSNNILKAAYALFFGKERTLKASVWLLFLGVFTIGYAYLDPIIKELL